MATILVVDDRELCREFLATLLTYAHHRVLQASDGSEALVVLRREKPDLIITDLLMPTMNGYELVHQIKSDIQLEKIPIIFYTASYLIEEAKLLADTCGVEHVLFKPSEPKEILAMVDKVLRKTNKNERSSILNVEKSVVTENEHAAELDRIGERLSLYVHEMEAVRKTIDSMMASKTEQPGDKGKLTSYFEIFGRELSSMDQLSHKLVWFSELTLKSLAIRQPKSLLNFFARQALQILGSRFCVIGIFNLEGPELKHLVTHGVEIISLKNESFQKDNSLVKTFIDQKDIVFIDQALGEIALPNKHPPVRYLIGQKIATTTSVYGFIYFADKVNQQPFNEDDMKICSALALAVAYLYENADMYEAIQRHAAKLQLTINDIVNE